MPWTLVILITLYLIYKKILSPHSHWQNLGVKCWKPVIFFGDLWNSTIGKEPYADMLKRQYDDFKSERFYGGYNMMTPVFYIKDPELLRQILIKDFEYFIERVCISSGGPLWQRSLVRIGGEEWHQMRCTLSPTFTSSKTKMMFDLIDDCANNLVAYFVNSNLQLQEIEMYDVSTRYSNDVIASCIFGVNCDSLADRKNQFYMSGRQLINVSAYYVSIVMALFSAVPGILNVLFGVNLKPEQEHEYFKTLISETIKTRGENNIIRKDMLQLLMEARKVNPKLDKSSYSKDTADKSCVQKPKLTLEDIQSQALTFFFGGVSSTSRLISFTAHELAINHNIQRRLLKEIDDTMETSNGILTYEALSNMNYLDMVVAESLRLWPPAPIINRSCTAPYKLNTNSDEPCINFKKGDQIYFPIFALHRDPQHFPDPEKFDPERFSEENKSNIRPYTYMPFGIGPRNCIAMRFALIEAKVALVRLLSKFELVSTSKTQVPLNLDKISRHPLAEKGFWIGLKLRSNH